MSLAALKLVNSGLEVIDIEEDTAFGARPVRTHEAALQLEAMRRIAHAFVEKPETVLQELVNAAVELCGADSAGISIQCEDATEEHYYHWIATAGQYSGFFNAILPQYPSACGVCLERGRPQIFRVGKRFFDLLGVEAPLVTDGLLLPWQTDGAQGTIFIMAHGRSDAFDSADCRMMQVLADFAASGVRQQKQRQTMLEQAAAVAAHAMANDLAHQINNPLQSLTNMLFLAAEGKNEGDERKVGREALHDLMRLSALVGKLLAIPVKSKGLQV